jgi:hypothetical protein
MANSYVLYTANGSTTQFSLVGIDGWINNGFLKVYLNDVLQTTGYTLVDMATPTPKVQFTAAPALNVIVRLQRETPATVSTFKSNIVDFNDGSILTAADLDKVVEGLLHITQEAEDTGSGAIGKTTDETNWDGDSKRLTNLDDGINAQDAATFGQLQSAALYGSAVVVPQAWSMTGTGGATYALSPAPLNLDEEMFIVEVGGVIQNPSTYTITSSAIVFDANVASGVSISVRNLGVSRNVVNSVTSGMIQANAVTTATIAAGAVTDAKLATDSVTTVKVVNDAITYAKIQNVSATDRILGRSSAGAGDIQEITCTAAGRDLLDDATASAQRTTLGLGGLAVLTTVADANVASAANISFSKLQTVAANSLLGNNTAAAATASSLSVAQVKTLLAYGTMAAETATNYTRWNANQVGTVVLMGGAAAVGTENVVGASVTNAAALNPATNLTSITAQSLAGAFEISSNNLRPTSSTGGTWFVCVSIGGSAWTGMAIRTA